eukprot:scaffold70753_cov86-Phaeocystis_antarctica.AAC.2
MHCEMHLAAAGAAQAAFLDEARVLGRLVGVITRRGIASVGMLTVALQSFWESLSGASALSECAERPEARRIRPRSRTVARPTCVPKHYQRAP